MVDYEEIIQGLLRARAGQQAVSAERVYFTKTDRGVDPKRENPFKYWPGTVPVLLSVPYSVRYLKNRKIMKSAEFTGSLGYLTGEMSGCHVLAVSKFYRGDPESDFPCIYKSFMGEICRKNQINLVLNLQGLTRDSQFDVDLAVISMVSKGEKVVKVLVRSLEGCGLTGLAINQLRPEPGSVAHFVSSDLGLTVVQVRVNRKYRVPNQNHHGFCRALAALVTGIKDLK
ncbi:MAG: hypothetical protein M0Z31_08715 [Clostridia bacterium]|nr:hypothetical protein [Clostridia bacterium]